jgi:hypothetical protein
MAIRVFHKDFDIVQSSLWFGDTAAKRGTDRTNWSVNAMNMQVNVQSRPTKSRGQLTLVGLKVRLSSRSGLDA